jgi:hypothetical protein
VVYCTVYDLEISNNREQKLCMLQKCHGLVNLHNKMKQSVEIVAQESGVTISIWLSIVQLSHASMYKNNKRMKKMDNSPICCYGRGSYYYRE